jgi:spore coat polysaccharide biosynthesis protein SpsF
VSTGLIVFARFDSRRLPGKALRSLSGRPLLGRVLDRARRVAGIDGIVVATSERPVDDVIAELAEREAVSRFRGAADDVAGRALACAEANGFARFVRISGDSPFFDPEIVARLIERHLTLDLDLATNVWPRSFPAGASAEVISTQAMRRACADMDDDDREHVTRYFYRHPDAFRIFNLSAPDERYAGVRLAVDDGDDLERATWIVERLEDPAEAAQLDDIVALARAWQRGRGPASGAGEARRA